MTDRPDSSADDSPEIAGVRRLLADARHTEPMPADVASRLDDVLADLTAERSQAAEPAPAPAPIVIPIAAHRRRRAAGLLVAAAAIVVGGVTLAQNVHLTSTNSSASTAEDAAQQRADSGGQTSSNGELPHSPGPMKTPEDTGLIVVHPRHFSRDALQGRQLSTATFDAAKSLACTTLPRHGRVVPAEYQHAPAALVYRRPEGSSQVVDLYVCGTSQPVRTTTLPAP